VDELVLRAANRGLVRVVEAQLKVRDVVRCNAVKEERMAR
jgi:hypothetical protein